MKRSVGEDALIGAGTVLDAETALQCIDAGARFIVSPALDVPTIEACRRAGIPIFAGALTPTEIVTGRPRSGGRSSSAGSGCAKTNGAAHQLGTPGSGARRPVRVGRG